jgi:hypothetical protein
MPLVNNFDKDKLPSDRPKPTTPTPSFLESLTAFGSGSNVKSTASNQQQPRSGEPPPPGSVKNTSSFKAQQGRSPYAGGLAFDRKAFILTSDLWQRDGVDSTSKKREPAALLLHAGPSEAQWSVAIRASTEDTKGGRAHYMQSRPLGGPRQTYFNLPTVTFTFQTGNILPIPLESVKQTSDTGQVVPVKGVAVPYGLQDFYYFMQLINQPPIMPSGQNEGKHNYLWVYYSSLQFPNIVLKGFIEPEGVSWSDTADAPNSFTWSATMAVYESSPDITNTELLIKDYLANITIF